MKTKIVTLVRNEQEYMKQWLDYHFKLGFDQIDIYEDFGSTSHADVVKGYSNVSLQKFEDKMPEVKFEPNANRYGLLLEKTMIEDKNDFDWILCIDIDEYLCLNEKYTLQSFLKEYSSFPGVCLFWRFMSANGHVQKCKDIVSSYTVPSTFSRYYINQFKSFFNLKLGLLCAGHCQHRARYGVNTDKKFMKFNHYDQKKFDKAWINHYFTRSWEDWLERIYDKGNLTHGIRHLADFFEYNEDMLPLKDQLLKNEVGRIPRCSIWLDVNERILFTGKTVSEEEAKALNCMLQSEGLQSVQDYVKQNFR